MTSSANIVISLSSSHSILSQLANEAILGLTKYAVYTVSQKKGRHYTLVHIFAKY